MPVGDAGPRPEDELLSIYREHVRRVEEIDRLRDEEAEMHPTSQALYIGLAALGLTGLLGIVGVWVAAGTLAPGLATILVAVASWAIMFLIFFSSRTNPAMLERFARQNWRERRLEEADRYARKLRNYRDRLQGFAPRPPLPQRGSPPDDHSPIS